jgi:hypothetical protein
MADKGLADNLYILADPSLAVLAGNLREYRRKSKPSLMAA